jgi:hypothetical protein
MVEGLTGGSVLGWGEYYFTNVYDEEAAKDRARQSRDKAKLRTLDYVLVVPTEPLARLATAVPRPGLIESQTVAVASVALWRVQAFNQLARSLGDVLTMNAVEITSAETDDDRRADLANAVASLSLFVHLDGVGQAGAEHPDGTVGWYRALVTVVAFNIRNLEALQHSARWRWLREWPYVGIDTVVAAGLIAVVALVAV